MLGGTNTGVPYHSVISRHVMRRIEANIPCCSGGVTGSTGNSLAKLTPGSVKRSKRFGCHHLPGSSCGRNVVASVHRVKKCPRCGNAPCISASNSNVPSR